MFLIPTTGIQDDSGVVALFAEDFNFASLWTSGQDAWNFIDNCNTRGACRNQGTPAPVICEEETVNHTLNEPAIAMVRDHDLKNELSEFCAFWECDRLFSKKACTFCPVVKDINEMANEQDLEPASCLPAYSIY
jgi:hypothetical protein